MVATMSCRTEREIMLNVIEYCRPYRGLRLNSHLKDWVYGDVEIQHYLPKTDARDSVPFAVYILERELLEGHSKRHRLKVVPVTVGQSIGMQDKNKKDAYIDDIVFLEPSVLRRVIWYDNRFCLESERGGDNINISYIRQGIIVSNAHQLEKYGNG